jgi:hypothetical protein
VTECSRPTSRVSLEQKFQTQRGNDDPLMTETDDRRKFGLPVCSVIKKGRSDPGEQLTQISVFIG